MKSLVFDPQVSRLLPGEKDSVLGPQLTRHPNPVVLKFEYASEPQGGLDKTQISELPVQRSGVGSRVCISNQSPGDTDVSPGNIL